MSYARWDGTSDVYVYADTRGGFTCENCPPEPFDAQRDPPQFRCATAAEMVEHLLEHRAKGDRVRDDTIEALRAEAERDARERESNDDL